MLKIGKIHEILEYNFIMILFEENVLLKKKMALLPGIDHCAVDCSSLYITVESSSVYTTVYTTHYSPMEFNPLHKCTSVTCTLQFIAHYSGLYFTTHYSPMQCNSLQTTVECSSLNSTLQWNALPVTDSM